MPGPVRHSAAAGQRRHGLLFNLSEPFVRRPIATSLLALGVLLLGIVARFNLPVAALPQVELPIIFAAASQPGASPQTMATTVAAPLERHFGQIAGLNELTSDSSQGQSTVIMQFDLSRDPDSAARDVAAAINAAAPDLPAGLPNPPFYRKANPNDSPVLVLALTAQTLPVAKLYDLADSLLAQRISQVSGVSQVDVVGGAQPAVRIDVNTDAVAAMGLNLDDVRGAINGLSAVTPKGTVANGTQSWVLAANDQLASAEEFQGLVIGMRNGVPIRLDAIAKVYNGQQDAYQAAWNGKQRAVLLLVRKQAGANVIHTVDGIKALLPTLQQWLPPGVQLQLQSDRTQTIRASVRDVQISLAISIALVILVMLLFLRRLLPTAIAGVTVPLSLAATFAVMWALGYSLDNFSLMALTISVGFVVDDAIVVIENIVRHVEAGLPAREAALKGGREIGFTVLSMSLSLIAVFIPILFMGGVVGRFFEEFAVTLASAIAISGVVSLTLTPSLCGRFLHRHAESESLPGSRRRSLSSRLSFYFERGFDLMLAGYRRGLDWSLAHSRFMLALTTAAVFVTVWLYGVVPKGFLPQQDTGLMFAISEGAQDISFAAMADKQQQAIDIVRADPAIATVSALIGGRGSSNNGRMFIALKPYGAGRKDSVDAVIARLRPQLAKLAGFSVFLVPVQDLRTSGRPGRSQYLYSLRSPSEDDLLAWVPKLVERLKTVPQLKDVSSDLEAAGLQRNVIIDRDRASRLGLSPAAIDTALNNAFSQRQIATTYTQLNQYRVVFGAGAANTQDPIALERLRVTAANGQSIPLATVAHFEDSVAPLSISHEGQFPVVDIGFNLAPGVALGEATQIITRTLVEIGAPAGLQGGFAGNAKLFTDSLKTLPLLILAALLTVYIVLGMLYESLVQPLTILSTLPTAGIGALLALQLTHTDLSIVSVIGIVLLIGIVKKNAIMMIDFALEAERTQGWTPREAIYQACLIRFRPIMMTTLAALFGALPLAVGLGIGSELRQPLGIAVVGGLLLSQALTLFTTPVVYLTLERWARRRDLAQPAADLAAD